MRGMFGLSGIIAFVWVLSLLPVEAQVATIPSAPEVRGKDHLVKLRLSAVSDPNGHDAFAYNGQTVPPVIRVTPGDKLQIEYVNALPKIPSEPCDVPPCMNMSNLHFHGLHVSPRFPQDDVLDMMAMPGDTLNYTVSIPLDQPPGLYWYHPHPTVKVTGKSLMECQALSSSKASTATCPKCENFASGCWDT